VELRTEKNSFGTIFADMTRKKSVALGAVGYRPLKRIQKKKSKKKAVRGYKKSVRPGQKKKERKDGNHQSKLRRARPPRGNVNSVEVKEMGG